jgi:hypothetical protein
MKKIILEDREELNAESGYITQNGETDNRWYAKTITAKVINEGNYREATEEEKESYENSLNPQTT